ncbi:MAG: TIGR03936 family radical SAM-associated protein [Clostridia bacterium]|nr:TIGR03936 family radical SAM-associated protein [Clostridia bacterium]
MRMIAAFSKLEPVKFVSHLDMQRLFQRAFRRAELPLDYSKGFNPHPLLSFATAISVGYTSGGEYFDVMLTEPVSPEEFTERVNAVLPEGVRITKAIDAGDFKASLTTLMRSAEYDVRLFFDAPVEKAALESAVSALLGGEIIVDKKTKGGIKSVDIRPMLVSIELSEFGGSSARLAVSGALTAEGGLPLELLFGALSERLGVSCSRLVHRKKIEMDWSDLKL